LALGIINASEAQVLRDYDERVLNIINVDDFAPHELGVGADAHHELDRTPRQTGCCHCRCGRTGAARCKNCDAVLLGTFLRQLQPSRRCPRPHHPGTGARFVRGLDALDSRLWRTLTTLWFKPGKLTRSSSQGRRIAYLPPFRL